MQAFVETFKDVAAVVLIIQLFIAFGLCLLVFTSDYLERDRDRERGDKAGNHILCALTMQPCSCVEQEPDTCKDCPVAKAHFEKTDSEEKEIDQI